MKQIIQSYKTGVMALEDVPRPQVLPGTLQVETKVSLVSAGTEKMLVDLAKKSLLGKAKARPDLVKKVIDTAKKDGIGNTFRKVRSKLDTPIPLGYSCAGIVRAVGAGVDEFQVGDRLACGGAGYANHADFNVVPKNLCVRIPERDGAPLSYEAASFATVGAIALQGVRQTAPTIGETICVVGLGLLGQITVQLCKANGCRVVGADIDPVKIELAKKLGADEAVNSSSLPTVIAEASEGRGADAVILTAAAHGSELIELAGEISRPKGRVVAVGLVGMNLPRDIYYKKELDLRLSMSYGPGRYDAEYEERGHDYPFAYVRWTEQRNMQTILELAADGRLDFDSLTTHRFDFEDALSAYEMITAGKEAYLGVLLDYNGGNHAEIIHLNEASTASTDGLKIGSVGAGNFARAVLLPRFSAQDNVELVGIATGRGMSAKSVGKEFGFQYCAENADRIITDEAVNTILVATRHNLHGPLVCQALRTGKHVFVEKPLCLKPEELSGIVKQLSANGSEPQEEIASGGPVLMVGFNRRFSPFVCKCRQILAEKAGPVFATYSVNGGDIPKESWIQDPEEGGGRILGEVCHFVDTLRYLCATKVVAVQAACVQSSDCTRVNRDSVAITLRYANGSVGTILYHALGSANYPKERLEAHAGGTTLVMDDFRRLDVYGGRRESQKSTQDKGFDAEIDAFAAAVKNGGAAPIPPVELVESTLVTFAVHEALNTAATIHLSEYAALLGIPSIC